MYEGFCIYDSKHDSSQNGECVILSGATKLPPDEEPMLLVEIVSWWLECLQEMQVYDAALSGQSITYMELEWSEEKQTFLL